MTKKILSALVATLALAGCDEATEPPKLKPLNKTAEAIELSKKPAVKPRPTDAGQLTRVEPEPELPKDALALEHDQPKVDHLARAQELKAVSDLPGALSEARRALFSDGTDEDALQLIAKLAPRTGNPAMAAEALGRIAQMHPDDAVPRIAQTRALIIARDFKAAIVSGHEAVKLDSQNVEAWHCLGRAHFSQGDLPSAIIAFEKAVELDPKHGYALNNLGLAYLRANENPAAAQVLERAAEQLPNVAYVQNNLGVAYERMGHLDAAKEAYSRATALSPKYVKAKVNSARVARVQITPDDVEELQLPEDVNPVPESTTP
jgi:tetratricopeptide (TPR) repeat protein